MRRLAIHQLVTSLAASGVILALAMSALAASPPVRTANSRQVIPTQGQTPTPLPPAPAPSNGLPPAPLPQTGADPAPQARAAPPPPPVPAPEPSGGPTYSKPFGTFKERVIPPKVYTDDPDGSGSYHTPTDAP